MAFKKQQANQQETDYGLLTLVNFLKNFGSVGWFFFSDLLLEGATLVSLDYWRTLSFFEDVYLTVVRALKI